MTSRLTPFSRWTTSLATACALLLVGCSTPPPLNPSLSPDSHAWSGRLGLQVQDPTAQEQSFSASFHLQGTPEQGRLDIFNPLGSQIALLQWQPGAAWLQQGQHTTTSNSLQDLLEQSIGTALPIQALFGWLQGQNTPAAGWQVDLRRHSEGRITAQRTAPTPQTTLRVVLQQPE